LAKGRKRDKGGKRMHGNQTVISDNLNQIEDILKKEYQTIVKTKKKMYILGDSKAILKRISGLYDVATLDCDCDLAYDYAELYDAKKNVVGLVYIRK
jgi:hypothetical protein